MCPSRVCKSSAGQPHETKLQRACALVRPKMIDMVYTSFGGSRFDCSFEFLWALHLVAIMVLSCLFSGSLVVSGNLLEDIVLCVFFVWEMCMLFIGMRLLPRVSDSVFESFLWSSLLESCKCIFRERRCGLSGQQCFGN